MKCKEERSRWREYFYYLILTDDREAEPSYLVWGWEKCGVREGED